MDNDIEELFGRLQSKYPLKLTSSFEKGFKTILKYTYDKIAERGTGMYPLTEDAYKYNISDAPLE